MRASVCLVARECMRLHEKSGAYAPRVILGCTRIVCADPSHVGPQSPSCGTMRKAAAAKRVASEQQARAKMSRHMERPCNVHAQHRDAHDAHVAVSPAHAFESMAPCDVQACSTDAHRPHQSPSTCCLVRIQANHTLEKRGVSGQGLACRQRSDSSKRCILDPACVGAWRCRTPACQARGACGKTWREKSLAGKVLAALGTCDAEANPRFGHPAWTVQCFRAWVPADARYRLA